MGEKGDTHLRPRSQALNTALMRPDAAAANRDRLTLAVVSLNHPSPLYPGGPQQKA
jgi:hypothetical protein